MNRNWPINLLLFLIAVGFPALRAVLQAIARQREAAKAEVMKQKRVEEALRTGKGLDSADQSAISPSDALEARRRAQLEELRRRGRERKSGAVARIPGSTGPTVPMPRPGSAAPARSSLPPAPPVRPSGRPAAPARPTPAAGRPGAKPTSGSRRQQQKQAARPVLPPPQEEAEVRRLVPDSPISSPAALPPAGAVSDGSPETPVALAADWRRALIMKEVLDPPLALRAEAEGRPPAFSA